MEVRGLARGLRGTLLFFVMPAFAGCAGLSGAGRALIPAAEISPADYDVRALVSLAPAKQADGEIVAAILYVLPGRAPLEVWEGTNPTGSRGWLVTRSLGKGRGNEHLQLVKAAAHYDVVTLPAADGRPLGYALIHKAAGPASFQDWNGKLVLVLGISNFIDPNYIGSHGGGR
jgi:hypothetical protein